MAGMCVVLVVSCEFYVAIWRPASSEVDSSFE